MFKVRLDIRGNDVQIVVTNKETNESRVDYVLLPIVATPEEAGRARARSMIKMWKEELAKPQIIEYEVD